MSTRKNLIFFLCMTGMLAMLCTGCGKKEEAGQPADTNRVKAEESTEVQEPAIEETTAVVEESTEEMVAEEEQVEDDMSDLSNEQWVMSLNVERPTFLVFNSITGERKALEDGAEYTLVEGDEFGITFPRRWLRQGNNITFYNSVEFKYNCAMFELNYDVIDEKTEIISTYNNLDGEPVTVTVYLSK